MSVNKATAVIQLAVLHIQNNDTTNLQKVLSVMPLDRLGRQTEALLSSFLAVCAKFNRREAAKIILEAWKIVYPPDDKMQLLSRLFLINQIDIEVLAFVVLSYDDFTYVELMDELIEGDSSPEVMIACTKADKIFGQQTYETYKIVYDHAYQMENDNVLEYAEGKMEETAPYAPIPVWVQNYRQTPLLTNAELSQTVEGLLGPREVPFEVPSDIEAVELLTQGLSHLGIAISEIDQAKSFLLQKLATSTREEKIELLRPIMENKANQVLGTDKLLFQIFGPANPLVDQDLTLNTPSSKYGGCRMFLCDIFDLDFDFDYVEPWFKGFCEQCHLRIRHFWHAVRRPRSMGGWLGCYHDFTCAREAVHWEGEEPDLLAHELINIFEKQTTEMGIQDRLPDPEIISNDDE